MKTIFLLCSRLRALSRPPKRGLSAPCSTVLHHSDIACIVASIVMSCSSLESLFRNQIKFVAWHYTPSDLSCHSKCSFISSFLLRHPNTDVIVFTRPWATQFLTEQCGSPGWIPLVISSSQRWMCSMWTKPRLGWLGKWPSLTDELMVNSAALCPCVKV